MAEQSCIIIGAGPAGLAAAIAAARGGRGVVVLEKKASPGRKLLLAGGGRANLTDPDIPSLEAAAAYGRSGRFLHQALASFSLAEFLRKLGVATEREKGGPRGESVFVRGGSRRLLGALLSAAERAGVRVVCGSAVRAAARLGDGGFEVRTSRKAWKCDRLIVAAGGMTYPSTGSCGDGYRLAGIFGHEVEAPRPALGALITEPCFPDIAGVSAADASITLRLGGRKLAARRGALLFTHKGVSGPPVLDLSLEMARAAPPDEAAGMQLVADLSPDITRERLVDEFLAAAKSHPRRSLENAGRYGALPARLTAELAARAGIPAARRIGQISRREFIALAGHVKSLAMTVVAPPDVNDAMVTLGGVAAKGLDPYTMESRTVPGLHFAGELLAPAGPCGGYNLLMAFATGSAAGKGQKSFHGVEV